MHISRFSHLLLHMPSMAIEDHVHLFLNNLQEKVKTHVVLHEPTTLQEATQLTLQADKANNSHFPLLKRKP